MTVCLEIRLPSGLGGHTRTKLQSPKVSALLADSQPSPNCPPERARDVDGGTSFPGHPLAEQFSQGEAKTGAVLACQTFSLQIPKQQE